MAWRLGPWPRALCGRLSDSSSTLITSLITSALVCGVDTSAGEVLNIAVRLPTCPSTQTSFLFHLSNPSPEKP
jgi:hypothetical protein